MRTRGYLREVRSKTIRRKKRIVTLRDGRDWYEHDGYYSKGKIHCGCGLCKFGRKYGLPTFKQLKETEVAEDAIAEYMAS